MFPSCIPPQIVSIKRDVVECLVHLTGRGYAEAPFSLLVKEVPAADAVSLFVLYIYVLLQMFQFPYEVCCYGSL